MATRDVRRLAHATYRRPSANAFETTELLHSVLVRNSEWPTLKNIVELALPSTIMP
jgi:hypothetical protein